MPLLYASYHAEQQVASTMYTCSDWQGLTQILNIVECFITLYSYYYISSCRLQLPAPGGKIVYCNISPLILLSDIFISDMLCLDIQIKKCQHCFNRSTIIDALWITNAYPSFMDNQFRCCGFWEIDLETLTLWISGSSALVEQTKQTI